MQTEIQSDQRPTNWQISGFIADFGGINDINNKAQENIH